RVNRGTKRQALGIELAVKALDEQLHRRSLELQPEIADGRIEQFVANRLPPVYQSLGTCSGHNAPAEDAERHPDLADGKEHHPGPWRDEPIADGRPEKI